MRRGGRVTNGAGSRREPAPRACGSRARLPQRGMRTFQHHTAGAVPLTAIIHAGRASDRPGRFPRPAPPGVRAAGGLPRRKEEP